MFKKVKKVNLRRRNDSDDDEEKEAKPDLITKPPSPQTQIPFLTCGLAAGPLSLWPAQPPPGAGDSPMQLGNSTIAGARTVDYNHGNGVQFNPVKKEKKEKKPKAATGGGGGPSKSTLSFIDVEEESTDTEVFRIKKSNHSKKIVKQLKKEYLEEVEKTVKPENSDVFGPSLPVAIKEEVCSEQGEEEMEVDSNDDQEEEESKTKGSAPSAGHAPAAKNSSNPATFNTLSSLSTLRPGEIPDAAFIHAARKRRQLARELGGDAPLVETEPTKKRQVREEEQDGSDDEDEDEKRISFSAVKSKSQRQKIAEEIGIEGSDDDPLDQGHNEELSRWEQEQIRKGISIPQVQTSQVDDGASSAFYQSGFEGGVYGATYMLPYSYPAPPSQALPTTQQPIRITGGILKAEPIAPTSCINLTPVSTELVKKRLRERLSQMKSTHETNTSRYNRIQEELGDAQSAIRRLEGGSNTNGDQYQFLQEMRGYVGDLLECFNEKVPAVLELEVAMQQLLRQRSSRLSLRRQDDIKDESSEFASLSSKALMAPSLETSRTSLLEHQEHARHRRTAEREARRTRRRQAREQNGKRAEHLEGLSSDDEETSTDITSFTMERDRVLRDGRKVFEDVIEDFHSLDSIRSRFEDWRRYYPACYRDAYISLCLPKLFNPLVRLQLLTWNPLEGNCPNFETMLWFESLLFYGCEEEASSMEKGDPDINLLPAIVERVLLPKLAVLTEQVWDPLSSSQTSRLVAFILKLIQSYPTVLNGENRNTQEFLKTVVLRIRRTLDEDVFLPLYPKNVLENKNGGPYLFFQRQFWSCIKLFKNTLQWDGILSQSCVKELALDSLLNRYILSALQSSHTPEDCLAKSQKLVELLPQSWLLGLQGQQTLPQLEPLCRYLTHLASTLYRTSLAGSDVHRRAAKEQIKDLVAMLGNMNALDHIITVATEHGIKDIKPLLEVK